MTDQIMLVLLKLKLNMIFEDLGRRFGISSSLACKIFNSWIPVLSDKLKSLITWLPMEVIRDCCPDSFRENYPRTTCIIDCAETFIQRRTNLRSRGETYSNYKCHNTVFSWNIPTLTNNVHIQGFRWSCQWYIYCWKKWFHELFVPRRWDYGRPWFYYLG